MAGDISRLNGKRGGRPKGTRHKRTIEREAALSAYQQLVLERLRPIFEHQYSLVKGTAYLYRIEERKGGAREHVLVSNPDEIGDVLTQMDSWEGQVVNDQYYYISVKAPDNGAIKDMLDRSIGKPKQTTELTGKDGGPVEIKGVTISVRK